MNHINRVTGNADLQYWNPDGSKGWRASISNGVTYEGINYLWEAGIRSGFQGSGFRAGLITTAAYIQVSRNDTHDSHPGWGEWTALLSATRPLWTPLPANGGLLGTLTPAHFDFTSAGQIIGAFLSTISVVGSTSPGVLYNTAVAFTGYDVVSGGSLDVSFGLNLAG